MGYDSILLEGVWCPPHVWPPHTEFLTLTCGKAHRYLAERRGQMRYDEYRSRGLPIGSGRVEAACKTVAGQRLKGAGMRWTVAGANAVLWVRCVRLGGWFDDYWDDRLRRAA